MEKNFKTFIAEGIKGPDTYGRAVKSALKGMEAALKKASIEYTLKDGYNMVWVNFLDHEILIDGENNRNKYKIYKNKRSDMFYGKPEHVINYIQTGNP